MKNKTALYVSIGILLVVLLGGLFVVKGLSKKPPAPIPEELTETTYPPADPSIVVELTATKNNTAVILKVSNIPEDIESLDYELSYLDGEGLPKGALSDPKNPIKLEGKSEFEREITLGTCSTGGKCSFDKGVTTVKVILLFHSPSGTTQFSKEFPLE